MSDKKPPIYAPFFIKLIDSKFGQIMKVSIRAEEMIQFINQHKKESGWLNIEIVDRKENDKGLTHSAKLDTWEPSGERKQSAPTPQKQSNHNQAKANAYQPENSKFNDEIPF